MKPDESPHSPALPGGEPAEVDRGRSPATALAVLALLLALAGIVGSGWLLWNDFRVREAAAAATAADTAQIAQKESRLDARLQAFEAELARLGADGASSRLSTFEERLRALEDGTRAAELMRGEQAALSRSLQASLEGAHARMAALEARLDGLEADGLDGSTELDLAELDYLLRLAQERLLLFGDVRTAERALGIADAQAAAFDDPAFIGVRDEIAAARRALAHVNLPDTAALDRELDAIQDRLQALPFRGAQPAQPAADAQPQAGWWARLREALAALVTVRRTTGESERLPPLADQDLIRQRAWLEVERVRLAAMRRDANEYQMALQRTRATLERWFEPRDRGTQASLQALASAAELDIDPELPDISGPWTRLRALRELGAGSR